MKNSVKCAVIWILFSISLISNGSGNPDVFTLPSETEFIGYGHSAMISFQDQCNFTFISQSNTSLYLLCTPEYMTPFHLSLSVSNPEDIELIFQVNSTASDLGLLQNHLFRDIYQHKYRFNSGFILWFMANISDIDIQVAYESLTEYVWMITNNDGTYSPIISEHINGQIITTIPTAYSVCIFLATPISDLPFVLSTLGVSGGSIILFIGIVTRQKRSRCSADQTFNEMLNKCEPKLLK